MGELKKRCRSNKGLSLVELIIVVCIIAIIVAVVGAFIIRYIEKSKLSRDVANAGVIMSAAEAAANEPEIYRELMAHFAAGGSAEYAIDEKDDFPSFGWNPLFETTMKQTLGNAPEFAYRKNNPVDWRVHIYKGTDANRIDVKVFVLTSAGEVELAPNPQAPYKE